MNQPDLDEFRILGHRVEGSISAADLETFDPPKAVESVTFVSHEVTAFCPVTGQPDFYRLTLTYHPVLPTSRCVESKSLKLYLQSFRDRGAFAEALAAEIAEAIGKATGSATWVEMRQQVRGGLELTATAFGGPE